MSNCGAEFSRADIRNDLPSARPLPMCGRIKLLSSGARDWRAFRNNPALPSLSLYGELERSSRAFLSAASSSAGVRVKSRRSQGTEAGESIRSEKEEWGFP